MIAAKCIVLYAWRSVMYVVTRVCFFPEKVWVFVTHYYDLFGLITPLWRISEEVSLRLLVINVLCM